MSYEQYIERIEELLIEDIKTAYPKARINEDDAVGDILENIFAQYDGEKFIFVLDEWDFIFHRDFINENDKEKYVAFLSNLLKRPSICGSFIYDRNFTYCQILQRFRSLICSQSLQW